MRITKLVISRAVLSKYANDVGAIGRGMNYSAIVRHEIEDGKELKRVDVIKRLGLDKFSNFNGCRFCLATNTKDGKIRLYVIAKVGDKVIHFVTIRQDRIENLELYRKYREQMQHQKEMKSTPRVPRTASRRKRRRCC